MPPLYGLDIETDTSVDGLDPTHAAVVAVALATPSGDEVFLGEERRILARLDRRIAELPPGVLVTWNGSSFDLPFLAARAAATATPLGLELWCCGPDDRTDPSAPWPPPTPGMGGRWGAHAHLDGYRAYRADVRRSLGLSCGLKAMARLVGLAPVEADYDQLHTLDEAALAAYVASDARLAATLVARRGAAALAGIDRPPTPSSEPPAGSRAPAAPAPTVGTT